MPRSPEVDPTRAACMLLAVGLMVLVVMQLTGLFVNSIGRNGEIVGIPFGQMVILAALYYSYSIGLPRITWGGCIMKGVGLGIFAVFFAIAITWGWTEILDYMKIPYAEQPMISRLRDAGPAEFAFIGIVTGFWGPLVEEIYFRGWWQSVAKQKLGAVWGIGVVAVAFALLHGSVAIFPGLVVAGICFGLAANIWGLSSAVAAHIVFNLITIIAARGGWL